MALTTTIAGLSAVTAPNLTDTAVIPCDDALGNTVKATVAQVRTQVLSAIPSIAVTGAATVGTTLAVTGTATVGGTLAVTGAATVGGTLGVTSAATFYNTVTVNSGLTSVQALTVNGGVKSATSASNVLGSALTTTATDGFLYLPTCAGAPTGVPTVQSGAVALVWDTTNSKLWVYAGAAWKGVVLA